MGKGTSRSQGIDRPVDDKQGAAGGRHHLFAVGLDDPRQLPVGGMILDKDGLARFIVGHHGLGARHDAAAHSDLAFVHRHPTPIGHHVPINVDEVTRLGRYQRR